MAAQYRPGPAGVLAGVRTVVYYIWIALVTLVMGIVWLPIVLISPLSVHRLGVAWSGQLLLAARVILGLKVEVRGTPPTDECLIAAKHQSFLDILTIANSVPQCAFVMKRALLHVPIMGYFARRVGCIPIDRSKGTEALKMISDEVEAARSRPQGLGQLIIYPEGTRSHPGQRLKYKHGVGSIYALTGLPVHPVGVNCGMFWPKKGFPIRPGTAIVEFLPPIAPGLSHLAIMRQLGQQIEGASDRLMDEAGGVPAYIDPASGNETAK